MIKIGHTKTCRIQTKHAEEYSLNTYIAKGKINS